jgi:hypothetical protein
MYGDAVEELQIRLVGKTVASVVKSRRAETVCLITTTDGARFHLHATELGSWVEDDVDTTDVFTDLNLFCTWVGENVSLSDAVVVTREATKLSLTVRGKTFVIDAALVADPWERSVLLHEQAPLFLGQVVALGDCWRMWFRKKSNLVGVEATIPEELKFDD